MLWQDGIKTLFDPCPMGWRVPKGGNGTLSPWSAFTVDNGPWIESPFPGRRFTSVTGSPSTWYAAMGCRDWTFGQINQTGSSTYLWQTSMTAESIVYIFQLNNQTVQPANSGGNHRAYGFPVRCVRE